MSSIKKEMPVRLQRRVLLPFRTGARTPQDRGWTGVGFGSIINRGWILDVYGPRKYIFNF